MADIAASVLAKLKNKAKASGISYQQCLQMFFQEEFLRRLAGSKYAENFVLKGGLFIYTLTNFESRATVDVDFLMRGLNNDLARMDEIIAEILSVDTGNDFVTFKATKMEPIAVQRKYHGISTQITGYIKNVRVPFNVDIGVGDVIVPSAQRRNIQTQLDGYEKPEMQRWRKSRTTLRAFIRSWSRLVTPLPAGKTSPSAIRGRSAISVCAHFRKNTERMPFGRCWQAGVSIIRENAAVRWQSRKHNLSARWKQNRIRDEAITTICLSRIRSPNSRPRRFCIISSMVLPAQMILRPLPNRWML